MIAEIVNDGDFSSSAKRQTNEEDEEREVLHCQRQEELT